MNFSNELLYDRESKQQLLCCRGETGKVIYPYFDFLIFPSFKTCLNYPYKCLYWYTTKLSIDCEKPSPLAQESKQRSTRKCDSGIALIDNTGS